MTFKTRRWRQLRFGPDSALISSKIQFVAQYIGIICLFISFEEVRAEASRLFLSSVPILRGGFFLTSNLKLQDYMEWLWITLGIIFIVVGIVGSLLPLLPGPPIAFAGLLLQLFREPDPFTARFLWIWAGVVVISLVLDYMVPIWGTKKFGGTKYGVWGCTLGFLLAFWMGPWGVIIGPFIGAFVGEMIGGQNSKKSFKAAFGSFIGFLLGSFLKLVICFMMLYYVIASI